MEKCNLPVMTKRHRVFVSYHHQNDQEYKTSFDINTLNALGSVKGSDVFVSYQKSATGILVLDGVLRTVNPEFPDNIINIREGNASFVPYNAPPKDPRTYLPMYR